MTLASTLLAACTVPRSHDAASRDAGRLDAATLLPGEVRTLSVEPSERIAGLAVDSDDALCALVYRTTFPDYELRYGCFDALGTFVAEATVATGNVRVQSLTLDRNDNPAMILGNIDPVEFVIDGRTHTQASCAVRLEGGVVWSQCIDLPFSINSFAINERGGAVGSIIQYRARYGDIGPLGAIAGMYFASGLPIVESSQLHLFEGGEAGPRIIAQDADGGWWVAGDHSAPTPPAWMLPETRQPTPFWAKVDANFNPIEVHTYAEDVTTMMWDLDVDGRPMALAYGTGESIPIYFVGAGFERPVAIGQGGYGAAVAASASTLVAALQFFQGPLEVGGHRFEMALETQVLATFTRTGELLTARQVPGWWPPNVVILADESIAYAEGNVVHVLSSR